jgi:hypothetical protein
MLNDTAQASSSKLELLPSRKVTFRGRKKLHARLLVLRRRPAFQKLVPSMLKSYVL